MTLDEVKQFLEENKDTDEVKQFLAGFRPGLEEILKTPDVLKALDQRVSQGINTYKEKTLPGLVEAEKKKLIDTMNPTETPEMKLIKELQQKLADKEKAELRGSQKNKVLKVLTDKQLAEFADLADLVVADNDEETDKRSAAFTDALSKYEQRIREGILKEHGTQVPKDKEKTVVSKEPAANASKAEWAAYYKEQLKNDK